MPSVLLVGAGADTVYRGDELDLTAVNLLATFKQRGWETIVINNNPFAQSLESNFQVDHIEIRPLTVTNVVDVIREYQPDIVVPTLGERWTFDLLREVQATGVFETLPTRLVGISLTSIKTVLNPPMLAATLRQIGAPVKHVQVADHYAAAYEMVREYGYPLVSRPVSAQGTSTPKIAFDDASFEANFMEAQALSKKKEVAIQQSLQGMKEVEIVVCRDQSGTLIEIATVENIDPIGIHAADSYAVTPAQTLLDRELQTLRKLAFKITRKLRIVGVNHVQFAIDRRHQKMYVTKVSPYFDRTTSFVELATGYPLSKVVGCLYTGQLLREIDLGTQYAPYTAITEPVTDSTAVRVPIFAHMFLPEANWRLGTQKRSIGTAVGIGRSVPEALVKALTYQEDDFGKTRLAAMHQLTSSQLDQVLIHPEANRIYSIFEALRRGYSTDEIAELTHIESYYISELKRVQQVMEQLYTGTWDAQIYRQAKDLGLPDATIARITDQSFETIRTASQTWQVNRTYKEVDPAAGEFEQHSARFYASFERENESQPAPGKRVLVVGPGPRALGNGTANDYVATQVMQALKSQGYQVILLNDNPSSVTMASVVADKIYVEPRTTEVVREVAYLEQPAIILVPSMAAEMRQFLAETTWADKVMTLQMVDAPHDFTTTTPTVAVNVLFDGNVIYPLGMIDELPDPQTQQIAGTFRQYPTQLASEVQQEVQNLANETLLKAGVAKGIYQLIFAKDNDMWKLVLQHPIPAPDVAFLSKAVRLNIAGLVMAMRLGTLEQYFQTLAELPMPPQQLQYRSLYPFKALHLAQAKPNKSHIVGATIKWLP